MMVTKRPWQPNGQLRSATINLRFTQRGSAARCLRCRWFTPNSKHSSGIRQQRSTQRLQQRPATVGRWRGQVPLSLNHIRHDDHVRLQPVRRRQHGGHVNQQPRRHGDCRGWVDGDSPGNQAVRPSRIPRSISSLRTGLPGGAVSRQLQLRPPNEFGTLPIGFGSAPTGAAPPTEDPRATATTISIFVITWWY